MKTKSVSVLTSLAAGMIAASLALPVAAEEKSGKEPVTGKVTLNLEYINGLQENGSPDPSHDAACKTEFSEFIGMPVTTQYSINTKTLMMSAESSFPSPNKEQPLELTVKLNASGISGLYAFGTFRPVALPKAYAVLFSINTQFTDAKSSFVLFGPKGEGYNCLISSTKNAINSAESLKFKME